MNKRIDKRPLLERHGIEIVCGLITVSLFIVSFVENIL
jgi:hypothetical protein